MTDNTTPDSAPAPDTAPTPQKRLTLKEIEHGLKNGTIKIAYPLYGGNLGAYSTFL